MGDLLLKQFSIVVMISAALMNGLSHIFNIFNLFFDDIDLFSYYATVVMRFGDLGLMMGAVGLYLSIKTNRVVRGYAILYAIIGMVRFLSLEYALIISHGFIDTFLIITQLSTMILFFKAMPLNQVPILNVKSRISSGLLYLFGIFSVMLIFMPTSSNQLYTLIISVSTSLIYIIYQIGVYIYFQEWYKEAYTYHNILLVDI
jgi:hypothetical protein